MVRRFAIKHVFGGFLDGNKATRLKIFLFGWSTRCVRGL